MKIIFLLALLCIFGCSRSDRLATPGSPSMQNVPATTLYGLVYVGMYSSFAPSLPLVCGAGGDFPDGQGQLFKLQSQEFVHAVFPEGVPPPKHFDGKFVLHGHYQTIQNRERYTLKQPSEDYQYFVVTSWENIE